jgi:Flp pilus assembly pilin Flp
MNQVLGGSYVTLTTPRQRSDGRVAPFTQQIDVPGGEIKNQNAIENDAHRSLIIADRYMGEEEVLTATTHRATAVARLIQEEEGIQHVEEALLLGIVGAALTASVGGLGSAISALFAGAASAISD